MCLVGIWNGINRVVSTILGASIELKKWGLLSDEKPTLLPELEIGNNKWITDNNNDPFSTSF